MRVCVAVMMFVTILVASTHAARAAAGPFTEKDFFWTKQTKPYKSTIVKGVNKIRRDNPACGTLDPMSATISTSKSTKSNPVFFVTCGEGAQAFNVFFSKKEVEEAKVFKAAGHINKGQAIQLCEGYAKDHSVHPSTVRFSRVMDVNYSEHPNGRSRLVSTFTAQNSYGTKLKYKITCLLEEHGLIEAAISEDRE